MENMKMMKIAGAAILAAGLLLGGAGSVWAAHLEDIAARGTLRVGTTGDYRPMSYKDADGKYEGFDTGMCPPPGRPFPRIRQTANST